MKQDEMMGMGPELVILSPPGGVNAMPLLARLTDMGVWFHFEEGYRLPDALPGNLRGARCILSIPEQIPSQPPDDVRWIGIPAPKWENGNFIERLPMLARLTLNHPTMRRQLESVPDQQVLHAARERMSEYRYEIWNDVLRYNLECLWNSFVLSNDIQAYEDALNLALIAFKNRPQGITYPYNCDEIACLHPLLRMAQELPELDIVKYARETCDIYLARAPRLRGVLNNFSVPEEAGILRSEIAFQVCPALARLSSAVKERRYADAAVEQLLLLEHELKDASTGLWHLGCGEETRTPSLWARGCVFSFRGLLDTLAELPKEHPGWEKLSGMATRMAKALMDLQDEEGSWHHVLDEPETRFECSASCWAVGGLVLAMQLGVIGDGAQHAIHNGWRAIKRKSWAGLPVSICAAVTASMDADYYRFRPFVPASHGHVTAYVAAKVIGKFETAICRDSSAT